MPEPAIDPPVDSDDDAPTDWPAFARDLLSGDNERLRARLPDWLRGDDE